MTSLLIFDEGAAIVASEAAAAISESGVVVAVRSAVKASGEDIDAASVVVFVVNDETSGLLHFWAGYAAGAHKSAALVADTSAIPEPMSRWVRVSSKSPTWHSEICDVTRLLLGWAPVSGAIRDTDELMEWVADDIDRLEQLSAGEYEQLFTALFTQIDCRVEHNDKGVVLSDDFRGQRFLAQFKFAPSTDTIGINAVRDSAAAVAKYNCDFGVVISNREFSAAARAYASEQSPALWLAPRDWFASTVRARFSRGSNLADVAKRLTFKSEVARGRRRWRFRITDSPKDGGRDPLHVFIFYYNDSEAPSWEQYFEDLPFDTSLRLCSLGNSREWRTELCRALAVEANVRVVYFDGYGPSGRQARSRYHTLCHDLSRKYELNGKMAVINDSPFWAQLCTPLDLEVTYMPRLRHSLADWLSNTDEVQDSKLTHGTLDAVSAATKAFVRFLHRETPPVDSHPSRKDTSGEGND